MRERALSWLVEVDPRVARTRLFDEGVVALRDEVSKEDCARWTLGTYAARESWTRDFGSEQFSLGRAFYTHLEQGKSADYFRDAAASDARVERHVPGLQTRMQALASQLTGGSVRPRRGWCGPGIHIFPAHGQVAQHGGVVHFDKEGLTGHQLAHHARALSVVCMLQPPTSGGGLRVWDVASEGPDTEEDEAGAESVLALYGPGDVVAIDSYRLHQIERFLGEDDRVSATIHLVEIDPGHWESWF